MDRDHAVGANALRIFLGIALLAFAIALTASPASATEFFASPSGADGNPGTELQPFRTLAKGISALRAGDTLTLREGLFATSNTVEMSVSGAEASPIVVRAFTGEHPVIRCTTSNPAILTGASFLRFEGLDFDGSGQGLEGLVVHEIGGRNSSHIRIAGCKFRNHRGSGLRLVPADFSIVEDCDFTNNGTEGLDHGIYCETGDGIVIRGCVVEGSAGFGIQVYSDTGTVVRSVSGRRGGVGIQVSGNRCFNNGRSGSGAGIVVGGDYKDVVVENNLCHGNATEGIVIGYSDIRPQGTVVRHNTCYGNGAQGGDGQVFVESATGTIVANNILDPGSGNGFCIDLDASATGTVFDRNLYALGDRFRRNGDEIGLAAWKSGTGESNALAGDPKFVGASGNDFHLLAGSPAADVASTSAGRTTGVDFDGIPRPQGAGPDIGAYELPGAGEGDLVPPAVAITSPADGDLVSGVVAIEAQASDESGVQRVEFFVNDSLQGSDLSAPYEFPWDSMTVSEGSHILTARAFDVFGNSAQSEAVTVAVSNPDPGPDPGPGPEPSGEIVAIGPGGGGAQLCAAIHPADPNTLLLGQDVGGILKSTDGGLTWRHVNSGLALPRATLNSLGVVDLAFHPAQHSIVFAATWGGLFRSTDGAETWQRISPPGDGPEEYETSLFSCVVPDPESGLVLAGSGDPVEGADPGHGLYRSTDGGGTFVRLTSTGIPLGAIYGRILIDAESPVQARVVYAATSQGLFKSVNGGLNYDQINGGFAHNQIRDIALSRGPAGRRYWLALNTLSSGSGGLYRSSDGQNWSRVSSGLPIASGSKILRVLAHPTDLNVAYAILRHDDSLENSGVFGTVDGGTTWQSLVPPELDLGWNESWGVYPEGGALAPSQPGRLLVCNEAEPILSDDGGESWRQIGTRRNGDGTYSTSGVEVTYAYSVKCSSARTGRILVGYEDIGLWRSDDSGGSWRQLFWETAGGTADGCAEVHLDPTNPDRFYAVSASWSGGVRGDGSSDLMYSEDGGVSWVNLTGSFGATAGRGCAAVDFTVPTAGRTILFAQHGDTLRRSTNGGQSWSTAVSGIASADRSRIFALAFDPSNPQVAFAGTHSDFGEFGSEGGLYRSLDGGATWALQAGFPESDVHFIEFAGSPRRLWVGGSHMEPGTGDVVGGLYASDDGGTTFIRVLGQPMVFALTAAAGEPSTLYSASSAHYARGTDQMAGLYRSVNNGQTWERLSLEVQHSGLLSLSSPTWDPGHLFIGTRGAGVKRISVSGSGTPGNQAPVADAGPDRIITLEPGNSTIEVTLDGTGSRDPDGTVAAFLWEGDPDPEDVPKTTVTLAEGSYVFRLTVTDNENVQSLPDLVFITVLSAPETEPTLPSLGITVQDAFDDSPLADVKVQVRRMDGRPRYRARDWTAEDGRVLFDDLPEGGVYRIRVRLRGYFRETQDIEIGAGETRSILILLEPR